MRSLLLRFALTLSVVLGLVVVSGGVQAAGKVDVFGYYYLSGETAPKGFEDISELHLSTYDYRDGKELTVPLYGMIRLKPKVVKGKEVTIDFPLVAPMRKEKSLTFTTKVVDGVGYRFVGAFTRLGNFPVERPEGEILLKGRLTKLKGGKVAAESEVGFFYSGGD